jgi:hypothetical protein
MHPKVLGSIDRGVEMKTRVSLRTVKSFVVFYSLFGTILFFQNCDGGRFSAKTLVGSEFNLDQSSSLAKVCVQANRGKADKTLRRLIKPEVVNTLSNLVGPSLMADSTVAAQLALLESDQLNTSPADVADLVPQRTARAMVEIASRLADLSIENLTARNSIYGACGGAPNATCVQTFINDFGAKVFRRPITPAESASFLATYNSKSGQDGLKYVLMRLLLSPKIVFHLETEGAVVAGRVRLTPYEVASRISYRLAGVPPDATLLQAAARNELSTVEQVRAQARRIASSEPQFVNKTTDLFRYYLQLSPEGASPSDPYAGAGALSGINTAGLGAEMETEIKDYINNIVWTKKGTFKDLMTSREVFPKTPRIAKILGVPQSTTVALTDSSHAGLILRPRMLKGSDTSTPAFHRGGQFRKRILCENVGAVDPNSPAVKDAQSQVTLDKTKVANREYLSALTSGGVCNTCHRSVNPIGFLLESYDQLGQVRPIETLFNSSGQMTGTAQINTYVDNPMLTDAKGDPIPNLKNAEELTLAAADSATVHDCFSKTVFEFQRARRSQGEDTCALEEIADTNKSTSIVETVIESVANEDIFWKGVGI